MMRSIRLVAYLVPLLAFGSVISLAASGPAIVAAGNSSAAFCPADPNLSHRQTSSTRIRMAQFGHCRCCGWDENKHCNHQCCN
jgi:hypothetical protein